MADKMSRLSTFINAGTLKVSDEAVEDTCLDLLNYTVLLCAKMVERRRLEGR
jgi:hypothetical protein